MKLFIQNFSNLSPGSKCGRLSVTVLMKWVTVAAAAAAARKPLLKKA